LRKEKYLYLLIVSLIVFLILKKQYSVSDPEKENPSNTKTINRETGRGFERNTALLEYSPHARCRMDCRKISIGEVEKIMKEGNINYRKSNLKNRRCPRYALEGITDERQRVRIVFAQCKGKTEVVTVIDLDTDWSCHCPGDKD
jgi:hypothetical protein